MRAQEPDASGDRNARRSNLEHELAVALRLQTPQPPEDFRPDAQTVIGGDRR